MFPSTRPWIPMLRARKPANEYHLKTNKSSVWDIDAGGGYCVSDGSVWVFLLGLLPASEPPPVETYSIDSQIDDTDCNTEAGEQTRRDIRIHQDIEIVQQESTLVRGNARPSLQKVFCPRQRAVPGQDFNQHAPDQGAKV